MIYNTTTFKRHIGVLFLVTVAVACSKNDVLEQTQPAISQEQFQIKTVDESGYHGEIVQLELAKSVASTANFQQLYGGLDTTKNAKEGRLGIKAKVIRDAVSLRDDHNQPALHVINYEDGGFVVLSAERGQLPVLAFSDDQEFRTNAIPSDLGEWVAHQKLSTAVIRTEASGGQSSTRQSASGTGMCWDDVLAMAGLSVRNGGRVAAPIDPIDPFPEPGPQTCNSFKIDAQVKPLIKTRWDQSGGGSAPFNYFTPNGALAGCGPVSMGQLMYYYKHPTYFNKNGGNKPTLFNLMSTSGSDMFIASFLKDIGVAAGSKWGTYTGAETGTDLEDMVYAFKHTFKYGTAILNSWNGQFSGSGIYYDLINGRPVLMAGQNSHNEEEAHGWVVDGFKTIRSNCATQLTTYLHMNWGWGGYDDGYFNVEHSKLNNYTLKPQVVPGPNGQPVIYKPEKLWTVKPKLIFVKP